MRQQQDGGGGIITLLTSPLSVWRDRAEKWRRLDPVEANLRRASHSVARPAVIVVAAILFFGASAPADFVAALVADPASMWPPAVVLVALLIYWAGRFRIGARRLAGYQDDGLLTTPALRRLAVSFAVLIWLGRLYPWPGATDWGFFAVRLVFLVAVWGAVTGATRYLLLTRRSSSAWTIVQEDIDANEFHWEPPRPRRRWWQ